MPLMTRAEVRSHVDTSLPDTALDQAIAAAELEITRWAGPLDVTEDEVAPVRETLTSGSRFHRLRQRPAEIVSVTSTDRDGVETAVVPEGTGIADEPTYRLSGDLLQRLGGPLWGDRTVVVYIPENDASIRRMALVDLIRLGLNYEPGMGSEATAGWSVANRGKDPETERDLILRRVYEPSPLS